MHRVAILIAKADLFRAAGQPEQGFSVALRAASVSFKARLMPCLWVATGLLANILNAVAEFDAGAKMLHAVIPQVRRRACFRTRAVRPTSRNMLTAVGARVCRQCGDWDAVLPPRRLLHGACWDQGPLNTAGGSSACNGCHPSGNVYRPGSRM
jgi:hypothetical protein